MEVRANASTSWGTVCDNGWDINDASVACRQLGFAKVLAATVQSSFGKGSGRIWLDNVQCKGNENSITDCARGTWGQPNGYCRQYSSWSRNNFGVAGVVCAGESGNSQQKCGQQFVG